MLFSLISSFPLYYNVMYQLTLVVNILFVLSTYACRLFHRYENGQPFVPHFHSRHFHPPNTFLKWHRQSRYPYENYPPFSSSSVPVQNSHNRPHYFPSYPPSNPRKYWGHRPRSPYIVRRPPIIPPAFPSPPQLPSIPSNVNWDPLFSQSTPPSNRAPSVPIAPTFNFPPVYWDNRRPSRPVPPSIYWPTLPPPIVPLLPNVSEVTIPTVPPTGPLPTQPPSTKPALTESVFGIFPTSTERLNQDGVTKVLSPQPQPTSTQAPFTSTPKFDTSLLDEIFCDVCQIEEAVTEVCSNNTRQVMDNNHFIIKSMLLGHKNYSITVKVKYRVLSIVAVSSDGVYRDIVILPTFANTRNMGWEYDNELRISFGVKLTDTCSSDSDDTVRIVPKTGPGFVVALPDTIV